MTARFKDLALDAVDHQALADWWCAALGYRRREPPTGWSPRPADWAVPLYDPEGLGPLLWITPLREARPERGNRLRVDVWGHAEELVELGATLVRRGDHERDWDVLADPEGNEFCVFPPKRRPLG
ncbi:VOC family protein [Streptomyces sp. JJ36]|uniref:VOC family protein n=1 Tax=Streptomyces sp. JJ36 TaxID=2736645 RepID=UPI001F266511|nr:VOC family protein [Streptomyces sp. JJ36]MCF6526207.1 VOC family protein [Streptomyces sp. JJ36]